MDRVVGRRGQLLSGTAVARVGRDRWPSWSGSGTGMVALGRFHGEFDRKIQTHLRMTHRIVYVHILDQVVQTVLGSTDVNINIVI